VAYLRSATVLVQVSCIGKQASISCTSQLRLSLNQPYRQHACPPPWCLGLVLPGVPRAPSNVVAMTESTKGGPLRIASTASGTCSPLFYKSMRSKKIDKFCVMFVPSYSQRTTFCTFRHTMAPARLGGQPNFGVPLLATFKGNLQRTLPLHCIPHNVFLLLMSSSHGPVLKVLCGTVRYDRVGEPQSLPTCTAWLHRVLLTSTADCTASPT
jgi:hypothetical protein